MDVIETFEEYKEYYERTGRFPLPQINYSTKILNDRQLQTKYKDYLKKIEKQKDKITSLINDENSPYKSQYSKAVLKAKQEARELDPKAQVFYSHLTFKQKEFLINNAFGTMLTLDPAHIFSCGEYPHLSSVVDNILMLPRFVHSFIDQYLDPFTEEHKRLTKEEHIAYWIQWVGKERYEHLVELAKRPSQLC